MSIQNENSDLVARQLAWQQWRTWVYDSRYHAVDRTQREAILHGSDRNAGKTARYASEAADDMTHYNRVIVPADTATKVAMHNSDVVAWREALERCERIMRGEE